MGILKPVRVKLYDVKKIKVFTLLKFQLISKCFKTSLLRRLQAQTLPDATPPIGKIYPFTKTAVTFEPGMRF